MIKTSTPTLWIVEIQKDALNKGSYISDAGPNYIVLGLAATILLVLIIVILSLYKKHKSRGYHRREILLSRRRIPQQNHYGEEDESTDTLSQNESVLSSVGEGESANSLPEEEDSVESSQPDLEDGITSPNLHLPSDNLTSNETSEDEMSKYFPVANESTRLGDFQEKIDNLNNVFDVAAKEISPYYSKVFGKSTSLGNDYTTANSTPMAPAMDVQDSLEDDANAQAETGIENTAIDINDSSIVIPDPDQVAFEIQNLVRSDSADQLQL